MPYTAFLHTHTLVVVLYLLMLIIKWILLISNSNSYAGFRRKTKIAEMVLGALLLITGIYLATSSPYVTDAWFITKLVLVLAGIGLGVAGFKRANKVLATLAVLALVSALVLSYLKPGTGPAMPADDEMIDTGTMEAEGSPEAHGAQIYTKLNCAMCHGEDGTMGLAGAKNLQASQLADEEIKDIIKNGKNSMAAYDKFLNEDELNALTAYVKSLRK